jgi:aerobic carbon-monoxide dehydrogenase medium subunit
MKPPDFDYQAPDSLEGAVGALASEPRARVIAGGQSLVPLLSRRLISPALLIDLRRIPGLDEISVRDDTIRVGAMVTQWTAEHEPEIDVHAPLLARALRHVGHSHTRVLGTIGGSVAYAGPGAELPAILLALDGTAHASGPDGPRAIPASELYLGAFRTSLAPDEILTSIELPATLAPGVGVACVEAAARVDVTLAGAVAQVWTSDTGTVIDCRIGLFGVGDRPVRALEAERAVAGGAEPQSIEAIVAEALVAEGFGGDGYRCHLAAVLARRAVTAALHQARDQDGGHH